MLNPRRKLWFCLTLVFLAISAIAFPSLAEIKLRGYVGGGISVTNNLVKFYLDVDKVISGPSPCTYNNLLIKADLDVINRTINFGGHEVEVYGRYYEVDGGCYVYIEESYHYIKVLDGAEEKYSLFVKSNVDGFDLYINNRFAATEDRYDSDQTIEIYDIPKGTTLTVRLEKEGYKPASKSVTVNTDGMEVYIPLEKEQTNEPPVADFSYSPSNPDVGETVRFTDKSRDADGRIVSWRWEFGDSMTSASQNPSHSYSREGSYKVCLTVTDDDGATNEYCKEVSARNIEVSQFRGEVIYIERQFGATLWKVRVRELLSNPPPDLGEEVWVVINVPGYDKCLQDHTSSTEDNPIVIGDKVEVYAPLSLTGKPGSQYPGKHFWICSDGYYMNEITQEPDVGKRLLVPYYSQYNTNWCALASLAMILKYYNLERKPWQIAQDLGLSPSEFGGLWAFSDLIKYVSSRFGLKAEQKGPFTTFAQLEEYLKNQIAAGRPVLLGLTGLIFGHAVVITGAEENAVYINDPNGALLDFLGYGYDKYTHLHVISRAVLWSDLSAKLMPLLNKAYTFIITSVISKTPATYSIFPNYWLDDVWFRSSSQNVSLELAFDGKHQYGYYWSEPIPANYYQDDPILGNNVTTSDKLHIPLIAVSNPSGEESLIHLSIGVINLDTGAVIFSKSGNVSFSYERLKIIDFLKDGFLNDNISLDSFQPGRYEILLTIDKNGIYIDSISFRFNLVSTTTTASTNIPSAGPGNPAKVSFDNISIQQIEITVNNQIYNETITITETIANPVAQEPWGEVYRYLDMETTILSGSIESTVLTFKVSKSWLENRGATRENVVIQRHDPASHKWKELPTTFLRESGNDLIYEAESSSFSVYAITAKTAVPSPPPPVASSIEEVIAKHSGDPYLIDDPDMLWAINLWINGELVPGTGGNMINDTKILELIDLWIAGRPVSQAAYASDRGVKGIGLILQSLAKKVKGGNEELSIQRIYNASNPVRNSGSTTFKIEGVGIKSIRVEIFNLSGMKVFDSSFVLGDSLEWHLNTNDGVVVANGVYLYAITIRGYNREMLSSGIKKLVVVI